MSVTNQNLVSAIFFDHTIYMDTSAYVNFGSGEDLHVAIQGALGCTKEENRSFLAWQLRLARLTDFFWHVAFRRREGE